MLLGFWLWLLGRVGSSADREDVETAAVLSALHSHLRSTGIATEGGDGGGLSGRLSVSLAALWKRHGSKAVLVVCMWVSSLATHVCLLLRSTEPSASPSLLQAIVLDDAGCRDYVLLVW